MASFHGSKFSLLSHELDLCDTMCQVFAEIGFLSLYSMLPKTHHYGRLSAFTHVPYREGDSLGLTPGSKTDEGVSKDNFFARTGN